MKMAEMEQELTFEEMLLALEEAPVHRVKNEEIFAQIYDASIEAIKNGHYDVIE
jgi:hypothetical protein